MAKLQGDATDKLFKFRHHNYDKIMGNLLTYYYRGRIVYVYNSLKYRLLRPRQDGLLLVDVQN